MATKKRVVKRRTKKTVSKSKSKINNKALIGALSILGLSGAGLLAWHAVSKTKANTKSKSDKSKSDKSYEAKRLLKVIQESKPKGDVKISKPLYTEEQFLKEKEISDKAMRELAYGKPRSSIKYIIGTEKAIQNLNPNSSMQIKKSVEKQDTSLSPEEYIKLEASKLTSEIRKSMENTVKREEPKKKLTAEEKNAFLAARLSRRIDKK